MAPGARLVLCETWGGNPILNGARKVRALIAGEQEEQGEDIILSRKELKSLDPFFGDVARRCDEPVRDGEANASRALRRVLARGRCAWFEAIDSAVLSVAPALRNWCGEAVITARRR